MAAVLTVLLHPTPSFSSITCQAPIGTFEFVTSDVTKKSALNNLQPFKGLNLLGFHGIL